jgi:hypothetical protein
MPLKHYKSVCNTVGINLTDDDMLICQRILSMYKDEAEHVALSGYGPEFTTAMIGAE